MITLWGILRDRWFSILKLTWSEAITYCGVQHDWLQLSLVLIVCLQGLAFNNHSSPSHGHYQNINEVHVVYLHTVFMKQSAYKGLYQTSSRIWRTTWISYSFVVKKLELLLTKTWQTCLTVNPLKCSVFLRLYCTPILLTNSMLARSYSDAFWLAKTT